MKSFITSSLSVSLALALSACGGGGGGSTEAPSDNTGGQQQRPTAKNNLTLTGIGLSGADSIAITESETSQPQALSMSSSGKALSGVSSSGGFSSLSAVRSSGASALIQNSTFSSNIAYKVLPDGTFEEVDLLASGVDARGSFTPVAVSNVGNGWTAMTFKASDVQAVANDVVNGQNNFGLLSLEVNTTYLVNNESSKAYKANFLGTPFFEYDKGEIGLIERGLDRVDDMFRSIELTESQINNIYDSVRFDANDNLYVISMIPDYASYEAGNKEGLKEVILKLNTSTLEIEEIPVVFNGDIDYKSFSVSEDGSFVSFNDGVDRVVNTSNFTSEIIETDNAQTFDLIFEAAGKRFGYVGTDTTNEVYEISFNADGVTTTKLSENSSLNLDSFAPHITNVYRVGGKTVVGGNGVYSIFNPRKGEFVKAATLNEPEDTFITERIGYRSVFNLIEKANGRTEIVEWTPRINKSIEDTLATLNIDSDVFAIKSFEVVRGSYITFEATIINPLDGYNIGDVVIANLKLLGSNNEVDIIKTIQSNEPLIASLEVLSQSNFVTIDGANNDWPTEYRIITDDISDSTSNSGDLAHLSMIETDDEYYFLIEAETSIDNVHTRFNISNTESIDFFGEYGQYNDGNLVKDLIDVYGIYAIGEKNIEVSIPKDALQNGLVATVNTSEINQTVNDVVTYSEVTSENVILNMTVRSTLDSYEVKLSESVSLTISTDGGSYNVLIGDDTIESLLGSVSVDGDSVQVTIPLVSIGISQDEVTVKAVTLASTIKGDDLDEMR